MVRRHFLSGDAAGPEAATEGMVAIHATDPASIYLSILARSSQSTLADIAAAMYDRRTLVRWMAMRRTLFLFPTHDIPTIQAAVSTPLGNTLRRRLTRQLERNGSIPAIEGDIGTWLVDVEESVDLALRARGTATGAQLSRDEPALRTAIPPRAPSDSPQNVTTSLLTMMSAEGRIVRGTATGTWTSRQHRWESVDAWWPSGIPILNTADAQRELARRWLSRFAPATIDDLQWWTGWSKTIVRAALSGLPVHEVDLHGEAGIDLTESDDDTLDAGIPVATLLPTLDPTPMGWKRRDWLFGIDQRQVFDTAGNIGPTVWWNGEIVGSWATAPTGEIRTTIVADRGREAAIAVDVQAASMQERLHGAIITPAIRTPLERDLSSG